VRPRRWIAGAATLAACQLATARPAFEPLPEALRAEIDLPQPAATLRLAEALRADSIPVDRVAPRDGYLETPWFEAATGRPTARRPVGPDIVRVRAWIDRGREGV